MHTYKITYVMNNDYCRINPSDSECLRHVVHEAETKTQAIMQLHNDFGYLKESHVTKGDYKNVVPIVWEIKEAP